MPPARPLSDPLDPDFLTAWAAEDRRRWPQRYLALVTTLAESGNPMGGTMIAPLTFPVLCNAAYASLLGYSVAEIKALTSDIRGYLAIGGGNTANHALVFTSVIRNREEAPATFSFRHRDGHVMLFRGRYRMFYDEDPLPSHELRMPYALVQVIDEPLPAPGPASASAAASASAPSAAHPAAAAVHSAAARVAVPGAAAVSHAAAVALGGVAPGQVQVPALVPGSAPGRSSFSSSSSPSPSAATAGAGGFGPGSGGLIGAKPHAPRHFPFHGGDSEGGGGSGSSTGGSTGIGGGGGGGWGSTGSGGSSVGAGSSSSSSVGGSVAHSVLGTPFSLLSTSTRAFPSSSSASASSSSASSSATAAGSVAMADAPSDHERQLQLQQQRQM